MNSLPTQPTLVGLAAELRYVLKHWHNDIALSNNPLAIRLADATTSGGTTVQKAKAVREGVGQALASLKPTPHAVPPSSPTDAGWNEPMWRNYLLLTARFDILPPSSTIAEDTDEAVTASLPKLFNVSQSTYYRHHEAALVQLEEAMRGILESQQRVVSPTVRTLLTTPPAPAKYFLARQDILNRLKQRFQKLGELNTPDVRSSNLIVIQGLAGMGKTTLLTELTHQPQFTELFSGVLWLSLGADKDNDLSARLRAWAITLGVSESDIRQLRSDRDCQRVIAARLDSSRMLVLLDDVWTKADAEMFMDALGPNCVTVITTRYPRLATELGVTGDAVIQLNELNSEQSHELLTAYASDAVTKFPQLASTLTEQLKGWPIAIRLAGEQLRRAAGSQQYRRIKQAFDELIASLPHSEPLGAMIAASDHSDAGRMLLQRLSTLLPKPVSFSEAFVAGLSDLQESETLIALDELVDSGLVEKVAERSAIYPATNASTDPKEVDRYALHPVIADYARTQLQNDSDAWLKMVRLVGSMAQTRATDYIELDQIMDHVRHALSVALEREYNQEYAQIVAIITPYLLTRSQADWLSRIAVQASRAAEAVQNKLLMTAHHITLAQLAMRVQDAESATHELDQALAHAESDDQRATIFEAQANVAALKNDRPEAARLLNLAIRAAQIAKKVTVVPRLMMQLDQLTRSTATPEIQQAAQTAAQQALQLWIQGGRVFLAGQVTEAERLLTQSVEIARRIQAPSQLVTSLGFLSTVAAMNANAELVAQCAEEGLPLLKHVVYPRTLSWLYASPALIHLWRGSVDEASKWIANGLIAAQQTGLTESASWLFYAQSLLGLQTGNLELAYDAAHEAVAIGRKAEHVDELPHPLSVLAYLAAQRGQFQESQILFADALAMCHPSEATVSQRIMVQSMRGEALYLEGRHDEASTILIPIIEVGSTVVPKYFALLRAEWTLAKVYLAQGRKEEARQQGTTPLC